MKFLITAGPTREYLDPVRFISNPSSGKMGFELARAAVRRGHNVILISGPTKEKIPSNVVYIPVVSALDMRKKVFDNVKKIDAVVMAAAVSDYRPLKYSKTKIKKSEKTMTINLVRNPDILEGLGRKKKKYILAGFAAETDKFLNNARGKLFRKNLDLIVLNDISKKDIGFNSDKNKVMLIGSDDRIIDIPLMKKSQIAQIIIRYIENIYE